VKVLIGVDPHKASVAVAAVDQATGEFLEGASFPQDRAGLRSLESWAKRFPERRWAVENAGGLGRHLAVRLAADGESVVDVPPKLSARVRVLSTGNARKNDGVDALATALAASRNERLAAVDPEAPSEVLRLLSERREDLVAERTRALNRLHGLLRDLVPGGVAGTLSAHRAARILRGIRPKGGASIRLRRRLASEVLRDVRTLDRKIADLNERIEAEVEASGTTLTEIFGIGPILAARIIGTVGNVAFPDKGPLRLLLRHGAAGGIKRRCGPPQALAVRQSQAQLRPAHGRYLPGQVGRSGRGLLPQEDCGGQVSQGGAAVPQEAHLRRRLQESPSGFASTLAQRRLTKRSREADVGALPRIPLPRLYEKWFSGGEPLL